MRLAGYVPEGGLDSAARSARHARDLGLARLWASELAHDPFIPLAFAGAQRTGVELGTSVAIAFARTPWAAAAAAWDVARTSGTGVTLGLGTQVRAHVRRRFGARWEKPVSWMRDYVEAVRAIWDCWQAGGKLDHHGEFFDLDLISPPFNPGPNEYGVPGIFLGGVSSAWARLAGSIADGFVAHGFNSPRYLTENLRPHLYRGDRPLFLSVPVLVALAHDGSDGTEARRELRRQVAFYASTPSYADVLASHDLTELGTELGRLAAQKRWSELADPVDDEVASVFGVAGTPEEVGRELVARYGGVADEVTPYLFVDDANVHAWERLVGAFRAADGRM